MAWRSGWGYRMRLALLILVIVAGVVSAGWVALHWIRYDVSFGMEATFGAVPTDDERLAKWVRSQPGVYLAGENRRQMDTGRWRVEIIFGMSRNGWGPARPDLDTAAPMLGYEEPDGPFRPSPY